MTAKCVLLRLAEQKKGALEFFKNNPYVTIHDYSQSSDTAKRDPYSVWIDLNYPTYVLKHRKPVYEPNGVKNIRIQFSTSYPAIRPTVTFPVELASIHAWNGNTICAHSVYNAANHTLVSEICNIMTLAANCPEGINYDSPTPDHKWLAKWTKESLRTGTLPTVEYHKLFQIRSATRRRIY